MAIIGCYALDLYCDNFDSDDITIYSVNGDKYGHKYYDFPCEYQGYDRAEAFKEARLAGWYINVGKDKALCPKCSKQISVGSK